MNEMRTTTFKFREEDYLFPNPMKRLQEWRQASQRSGKLCKHCCYQLDTVFRDKMQAFWATLPFIFSLHPSG
ncbi:hypothetical protein NM688_g9044 [Phlebia brevispora]|uniref:Uncharacterized protein n=1 Tax=Phlebia brevispora TaxID=194682 RepID=A0ACC1RK31_9APHY|nr:hypothetical protein NM688_g9044 [Phlebia brevispora]